MITGTLTLEVGVPFWYNHLNHKCTMTKKIHQVQICYTVMVVADYSENPINGAVNNIEHILKHEHPEYKDLGAIYALDKNHPWYNLIPYGDTGDHTCSYYTTKEKEERVKFVDRIKDMLTTSEWNALIAEIKGGM